jgi:uncharacterized protein YcfJ
LREAVAKVTGDRTIVDVAEFFPRGAAAAAMAGAAAGAAIGSAAGGSGSWGTAVGAGAGAYVGQIVQAEASTLPKYTAVGDLNHRG